MEFSTQHDGRNVSQPVMGMAELEWFTARRVRQGAVVGYTAWAVDDANPSSRLRASRSRERLVLPSRRGGYHGQAPHAIG
jgi:hypothetical protein